jgi:predicted nucleic acid-binding protein
MNYGISRNGGKMDIKSFYTKDELATTIEANGTSLDGLPLKRLFTIEELIERVGETNGAVACLSVVKQINESVQDDEDNYWRLHLAYWNNFANAYFNVVIAENETGLRLR